MATPQQKLADSLEKLHLLQSEGRAAIRARDLTRVHRERLTENGYLQEVMKGWYVPVRPDDRPGDTTPWYSSFWDFCADYCNDRFGSNWCLSAEQSISLHVGNRRIPSQLQVRTPKGGNKPINLLHATSIFPMRLKVPAREDIVVTDGLNLHQLASAIVEVVPTFFSKNPTDVRAALAAIPDASHILRKLLEGGHSTIAGRLCGAFRNIGRDEIADEIKQTMLSAGYDVREVDPFKEATPTPFAKRAVSPKSGRMNLVWQQMRHSVIQHFPTPTAAPIHIDSYMADVEDEYANDAYHSLSIEGYRVSTDLIEQIRLGQWHPHEHEQDRQHQDALAAHGYYRAFRAVKTSVARVLGGENAGIITKHDHREWYRELFSPLVTAGLLHSASLAGYRNSQIFIQRSRHLPVSHESVSDMMSAFFDLLEHEENEAVRVVIGHFVFVYIHPYMDGNGRIARFLMNVMLASGGYPWTVIPLEKRNEYMASLEAASVDFNILPFTQFLADLVQHKMDGLGVARLPNRQV